MADDMMVKDRISKDDQTLKAPKVPPEGKRKGKRLPRVKGKFTAKQAGDALAMEG